MMRAAWPLFLVQAAGNALLLWLGYYWLGVGESRALALLWSALVALAMVVGAGWLHGAAFVWFAHPKPRLRAVFARALRRLLPLLAAAAVVAIVYVLANLAADSASAGSFKLASWLTLKMRKPVRPSAMLRVCAVVFWVVRWVVLPVFLLPMIAGVAAWGWRGFGEFSAGRGGGCTGSKSRCSCSARSGCRCCSIAGRRTWADSEWR
jgi:hypothetical protein